MDRVNVPIRLQLRDVDYVRKIAQMSDDEWWNHIKDRSTLTQTLDCYGWKGDAQSEENRVNNVKTKRSEEKNEDKEPEYIRKRKISKLVAQERQNIVQLVEDREPMRITKKQIRRMYAQERTKSKNNEDKINNEEFNFKDLKEQEMAIRKEKKEEKIKMQIQLFQFNSSVLINEMKIKYRNKKDKEVIPIEYYEMSEIEIKKAFEKHMAEVELNKEYYEQLREDLELKWKLLDLKFGQNTTTGNSTNKSSRKRKVQDKKSKRIGIKNKPKDTKEILLNNEIQESGGMIGIKSEQRRKKEISKQKLEQLLRRQKEEEKENKNSLKSNTDIQTKSCNEISGDTQCSEFIIKLKTATEQSVIGIKPEYYENNQSDIETVLASEQESSDIENSENIETENETDLLTQQTYSKIKPEYYENNQSDIETVLASKQKSSDIENSENIETENETDLHTQQTYFKIKPEYYENNQSDIETVLASDEETSSDFKLEYESENETDFNTQQTYNSKLNPEYYENNQSDIETVLASELSDSDIKPKYFNNIQSEIDIIDLELEHYVNIKSENGTDSEQASDIITPTTTNNTHLDSNLSQQSVCKYIDTNWNNKIKYEEDEEEYEQSIQKILNWIENESKEIYQSSEDDIKEFISVGTYSL